MTDKRQPARVLHCHIQGKCNPGGISKKWMDNSKEYTKIKNWDKWWIWRETERNWNIMWRLHHHPVAHGWKEKKRRMQVCGFCNFLHWKHSLYYLFVKKWSCWLVFVDRGSIRRQCRSSVWLIHCDSRSTVHTDAAGRSQEIEWWHTLCCWVQWAAVQWLQCNACQRSRCPCNLRDRLPRPQYVKLIIIICSAIVTVFPLFVSLQVN